MNRRCVRHQKFDECVKEFLPEFPHMERIITALVWEIDHNPRCGVYVASLDIWFVRLAIPPALVVYVFDHKEIFLLTIVASDSFDSY